MGSSFSFITKKLAGFFPSSDLGKLLVSLAMVAMVTLVEVWWGKMGRSWMTKEGRQLEPHLSIFALQVRYQQLIVN
jgi:hypothetical protein